MRSRTTGQHIRFWCLCYHQIASWWGGSFCCLPRSWTSLARALLWCRLYWGVLLFYLWIQFVDWRIFQKSVVAGWQWKLLGCKWLNQLAYACVYYWLSICIKFNFLYHFTRGAVSSKKSCNHSVFLNRWTSKTASLRVRALLNGYWSRT